MKFALLAILFAAIYTVQCKPQEDVYGEMQDEDAQDEPKDNYGDYDSDDTTEAPDDENSADEAPPKIVSPPQKLSVMAGQDVTLYCNVTNVGAAVLVWKKDGNLIYQGSTKLGNDLPNTKVENDGQTFRIFRANEDNNGEYGCHVLVSAEKELSLIHIVEFKTPPVIKSLMTENNITVYNVSDTVTLICTATGMPKPVITWHLKNERLGVTGERFTIENIKLKDAGRYRCLADNGTPEPGHASLKIEVNHKPIVSIDEYIVNSDHNENIELRCDVKGYPPPFIVWQNDGHNILSSGNVKITSDAHHTSLSITNASERDFTTYTCSAKNHFGKVEKNVTVVKTPAVLHGDSRRSGKDFRITFKVRSKSPVTKHELEFRKKGDSNWNKVEPKVIDSDNNVYLMEYVLKNVEYGTYETKARSYNSHGWSEFSDVHEFSVKHHNSKHKNKPHKEKEVKDENSPPVITQETVHKESPMKAHEPSTPPAQHQETMHKETPLGASQTGGSSTLSSSIVLLSIALLSKLW